MIKDEVFCEEVLSRLVLDNEVFCEEVVKRLVLDVFKYVNRSGYQVRGHGKIAAHRLAFALHRQVKSTPDQYHMLTVVNSYKVTYYAVRIYLAAQEDLSITYAAQEG